MRRARVQRGLTLEEAEAATKIRIRYLRALEEGNEADLPEPVFVRGFLRTYAAYLGLDPQAMLEAYRAAHGESTPEPSPPPLSRRSERLATGGYEGRRFWIGLLAIVVLVGLIWELAASRSHRPVNPVATIRRVLRSIPHRMPAAKRTVPSGPRLAHLGTVGNQVYYAVYGGNGIAVQVSFSGPCWLEPTVDGQVGSGVTYTAGQSATWRATRELALWFGAPANATIVVNGLGPRTAGPCTTPRTLIFTAYPASK